ncbi:hypothetical protein AB0165_29325 [Klebsiella variicola]|uniref:hypothetical protein n=1 Tax=Klebsiella variicola TaxID=244366 RepID=UPI0031D4CA39
MFAGKKSAQIREILISESAWEEMTCLFAPSLEKTSSTVPAQIEKLPFSQLIRRIGPGIVLTGVVVGPGAITTASMLGADYGYSLLWLLIPIAFMGITFMLTTYRISMGFVE